MFEPRVPVLSLLQALEWEHGEHPSGKPDRTSQLWHIALRRFSDEQIAAAIEPLLTKKIYGTWPKPADVAEIIEGRIVKVPEYATDLSGSRFRERPNGPLVVDRWHEVVVPHDWRGDPGELDIKALPADIQTFQAGLKGPDLPQIDRTN